MVPLRFKQELLGAVIQGHHLRARELTPKLLQTVSSRWPLNRAHKSVWICGHETISGMRKKITLISLIAVLVFFGVISCESWFVAFLATKYLSGRTDGKQGIVRSIIISPWRNYQLHLHHWFLALIVGGVFAVNGFYILTPEAFYGALSAIVFQGIYCYKDWYRVMKRRNVLPSLAQPTSLVAENGNMIVKSPTMVTVIAS